jgi:effector-binding domain-containing protein
MSTETMTPAIEIREVPERQVAFGAATCAHAEIGPTLMTLLPRAYAHVQGSGAAPDGPPFCRYTDWRESDCDLEGGCAFTGDVAPGDGVQIGSIGGGRALFALHVGPYDQLSNTHGALHSHLAEQGLEMTGAPYEIYITDPETEPDASKWETEVYWPIR